VKQEDGDSDAGLTEADVREAYEKDALKKLLVKDLKAFLAQHQLGKGITKKDDLVDAVTRFFEDKMQG
jgi:ATP-dependent DNA helicase 2 subunit 1